MIEALAPFALIFSGIAAGINIVIDDIRTRIMLLSVQYICITILVSLSIPLRLAIVKLMAGITVIVILLLTNRQMPDNRHENSGRGVPTGWIFRILAVLLVSTSAIGLGGIQFLHFPGIHPISAASSILLMGLGLLQLGLTERPFGIGMGLLTLISGFEIIYTGLEPSLVVMALIAAIHVGITIVTSILDIDVKLPYEGEVLE